MDNKRRKLFDLYSDLYFFEYTKSEFKERLEYGKLDLEGMQDCKINSCIYDVDSSRLGEKEILSTFLRAMINIREMQIEETLKQIEKMEGER